MTFIRIHYVKLELCSLSSDCPETNNLMIINSMFGICRKRMLSYIKERQSFLKPLFE